MSNSAIRLRAALSRLLVGCREGTSSNARADSLSIEEAVAASLTLVLTASTGVDDGLRGLTHQGWCISPGRRWAAYQVAATVGVVDRGA